MDPSVAKNDHSVADPGFSPGGAPTPKIAIIFRIFAENCMKMKEFGSPGGRASLAPPWIRQCHWFSSEVWHAKILSIFVFSWRELFSNVLPSAIKLSSDVTGIPMGKPQERENDYIAFDEYYNEPIGRSFGNCDIPFVTS